MIQKEKDEIDAMPQSEMCSLWRFARVGHPLFQGDTGDYFAKVMKEKGGMTPKISKDLGWDK